MSGRKRCLAVLIILVGAASTTAADPELPPLPVPVSNNAVAGVTRNGVQYLMSFMGLGAGKTHSDIVKQAWLWTSETRHWSAFPDVPVDQGRLASVAVGLNDRVILFGGYTVEADGGEFSTPEVYVVDPVERTYKRRADMPVPVDDTVALPYTNRYIYLVSGWHDTGNVSAVQLYDTREDTWATATDFPGVAVFGHAGGIVGRTLIIAGGVGVLAEQDGKREFGAIDQAWKGEIDADDPARITWAELPTTAGTNRYRMAATGDAASGLVIFAGGTKRPYNFSGIGYDGQPAEPSGQVFALDIERDAWVHFDGLNRPATMDHRGLLPLNDGVFVTFGGMGPNQEVIRNVTRFQLTD